jgi:hypothetical protein
MGRYRDCSLLSINLGKFLGSGTSVSPEKPTLTAVGSLSIQHYLLQVPKPWAQTQGLQQSTSFPHPISLLLVSSYSPLSLMAGDPLASYRQLDFSICTVNHIGA